MTWSRDFTHLQRPENVHPRAQWPNRSLEKDSDVLRSEGPLLSFSPGKNVMSLFLAKETREGPFGAHSGFRSGNLVVRGLQDLQGRGYDLLGYAPNPRYSALVGIARMPLATATLCIVLIRGAPKGGGAASPWDLKKTLYFQGFFR